MIKIENFSKGYKGVELFRDFNLEVSKGEIVGIKGETGVGKTTLLRSIAGLESYAGRIDAEGEISYLFQDQRLVPWLNVRKNVLLPIRLKGRKPNEEELERVEELSTRLGVEDHLRKNITDVSGGQLQRVLLVRALVTDPDLVLLDEPFKSLDADTREKTYREILDLCRAQGKTVLVASHHEEIEDVTDRTVDLN